MSGATVHGPATGAVGEERTRILYELLARMDDLAARGAAAIRTEIPSYRERDEAFFADVRDQVQRHYRANLHSFLEDREVGPEDMPFTRAAASRRARIGFALEDYLNAFRVGQRVLWDAVLEVAGDAPLGREAALTLVTPVMRYADVASTYAARFYVESQERSLADADRERRDLLEHLLSGELPVRGHLLRTARAHGIAAGTRMLVAVAMAAAPCAEGDVPPATAAAILRAGLGPMPTLVVVRHGETVAVRALAAGDDEAAVCERLADVQRQLAREGTPLSLGIGTLASGVADLPRAYAEARTALEWLGPEGGVTALPLLRPVEHLLMRADATTWRLVDPRIAALLRDDAERGGVLAATLRTFAAADLNLRVAAERLQVHLNTAQYRLNRVEERTGRNPRCIRDLLDLLVAIELERRGCAARAQPATSSR